MDIKTFMAAAVVSLTAACAPTAETASVAERAGPAADEALAAANTEAVNDDVTAPELSRMSDSR